MSRYAIASWSAEMVLVPISDFQRSLGSLDLWKDQILLRLHAFNNDSEVIRL
jgi:hypothetical protein